MKLSIEGFFKISKETAMKISNNTLFDKDNVLNQNEFELLMTLKSKKVSLLSEEVYFELYLQVVDIVFAYLYDIM